MSFNLGRGFRAQGLHLPSVLPSVWFRNQGRSAATLGNISTPSALTPPRPETLKPLTPIPRSLKTRDIDNTPKVCVEGLGFRDSGFKAARAALSSVCRFYSLGSRAFARSVDRAETWHHWMRSHVTFKSKHRDSEPGCSNTFFHVQTPFSGC